jgi:hypothetical protein
MTVYANLVENEVAGVYDLLPLSLRQLNEEQLRENGFVKIVRDTTPFNVETHKMSDFPWYSVENGNVIEHREIFEIPIPTRDDLLFGVRLERDRKMADFQWRYERYARQVRLGIPTTDNLAAMDAYMQALADITTIEDLNNLVFPEYTV